MTDDRAAPAALPAPSRVEAARLRGFPVDAQWTLCIGSLPLPEDLVREPTAAGAGADRLVHLSDRTDGTPLGELLLGADRRSSHGLSRFLQEVFENRKARPAGFLCDREDDRLRFSGFLGALGLPLRRMPLSIELEIQRWNLRSLLESPLPKEDDGPAASDTVEDLDDGRGEELADVVLTLLEFRGTLLLQDLPPLLRQLVPDSSAGLDASAVRALLEDTDTAEEGMFRIEGDRLVHAALSLDDASAVAAAQVRFSGVPPYMPTPEDLAEEDLYWLGGQPEFVDALVGALEAAGVPEEDAFELAWAAFYWDNADAGRNPDAVFQRLVERIGAPVGLEGMRRLRTAFDRWTRLHPKWILHGRTEDESSRLKPLRSASPDSRILHPDFGTGRNDPCPCGSGKKYKNCHGR